MRASANALWRRPCATTGFDSAVGTFSIDRNGDTSLDRIAGYTVRDGGLELAASLAIERRLARTTQAPLTRER